MKGTWQNTPTGRKFVRREFQIVKVNEFEAMVRGFDWDREVTENHIHHTYRPSRALFEEKGGLYSVAQTYTFHSGINPANGEHIGASRTPQGLIRHRDWSDMGHHVQVFPDGTIAIGRDWNRPPASATGHNGSSRAGPFMMEIQGDLRNPPKGEGPMPEPQAEAVAGICAAVNKVHHNGAAAMRFHMEMASTECPGDISKPILIKDVQRWMDGPSIAAMPTPKPEPSEIAETDAMEEGERIDWDAVEKMFRPILEPQFEMIKLITGLVS